MRVLAIMTAVAVCVGLAVASPVHAANAVDDTYTVMQGSTLMLEPPGLLTNDTGLYIDSYSTPSVGALDVSNNGIMTYSPGDFVGTVTFTYQLRDNPVDPADEATVTINVIPAAVDVVVSINDTHPEVGDVIEAGVVVKPLPRGLAADIEVQLVDISDDPDALSPLVDVTLPNAAGSSHTVGQFTVQEHHAGHALSYQVRATFPSLSGLQTAWYYLGSEGTTAYLDALPPPPTTSAPSGPPAPQLPATGLGSPLVLGAMAATAVGVFLSGLSRAASRRRASASA